MKKKKRKTVNPKTIRVDGKETGLKKFIEQYKQLLKGSPKLNKYQRKAIKHYYREEALKPYQAELLQLQQYLEATNSKMIIPSCIG